MLHLGVIKHAVPISCVPSRGSVPGAGAVSSTLGTLSYLGGGGEGPPMMDVSNNSDAKKNLRQRCFGYFCF